MDVADPVKILEDLVPGSSEDLYVTFLSHEKMVPSSGIRVNHSDVVLDPMKSSKDLIQGSSKDFCALSFGHEEMVPSSGTNQSGPQTSQKPRDPLPRGSTSRTGDPNEVADPKRRTEKGSRTAVGSAPLGANCPRVSKVYGELLRRST